MQTQATVLDMDSYARREHFNYFCSLAYPYVGVTCNVDITGLLAATRRCEQPFFPSVLWHVSRAANAVPELRQRIKNGGILQYTACPTSHTVAKADGSYSYCRLDSELPLEQFIPLAEKAQQQARESGNIEEDVDSSLPMLFITTLPWLSYTALVQPVPCPADSNPRISWGRYFQQGGRTLLPLSILCHHALVDGRHLSQFYGELDALLKNSSAQLP